MVDANINYILCMQENTEPPVKTLKWFFWIATVILMAVCVRLTEDYFFFSGCHVLLNYQLEAESINLITVLT